MNKARKTLEKVLTELLEVDAWHMKEYSGAADWGPDMIVTANRGKDEFVLLVEVKTIGEPRNIAAVAGRLRTYDLPGYPVLVVPFISERGRELCKELGLGFVDLSGNVYLKTNGTLIEIWGKDSMEKEKRVQRKLFTTKSTWIMRKMLASPNREWKFEDLMDETGVSLGQVYKTIDKLNSEGFVKKERGSITLIKPDELLDAWSEVYKFDEQEIVGYYCPLREQVQIFDSLKKISPMKYALTMGAAASLVAPLSDLPTCTYIIKMNRVSSFNPSN